MSDDNPLNLTEEQLDWIRAHETLWECPKGHEVRRSQSKWCGKNLYCKECDDFWYYKEYKVKDE